MCLLILVRGVDPDYPLIVASNRDEHRERKAAPPGLFVGDVHRMISPRDRRAGGTWMALNENGMFVAITNVAGASEQPRSSSRGDLPHLALDQSDVASAVDAVRVRCGDEEFNPFQLLIADRDRARVVVFQQGRFEDVAVEETPAVLSNEHRLGELVLPQACSEAGPLDERIEEFKRILVDRGELTGHRILKKGGEYGTVSSSILAIPAVGILGVQWWYSAGEPDVTPYRNYGNLASRLQA